MSALSVSGITVPSLDERGRRLHAAAEAVSAGHGGIAAASRATKVARSTIGRGLKDLNEPASLTGGVRRKGAGRRALTTKDPMLLDALKQLLEPATMGDPVRPLRWVSKSHEKLAVALCETGHQVSASTIPKLLEQLSPSRQPQDRRHHPDPPHICAGSGVSGYQLLSEGHQGVECGDSSPQRQRRRVPSGLELYHIAQRAECGAVIVGRRLS